MATGDHGVTATLIEKVKTRIEDFFELSLEEKKEFWQQEGEVEGYGQAFVHSDEQKLDWADMFFLTLPVDSRKPHLFPKLPAQFRDALNAYSLELKELATVILMMMEKTLQTEVIEITKLFEDGKQSMRLNCYPPCPQPEQVIGLTPYSDATDLTILFQNNDIEGLQIRKEGVWNSIKRLPDAFIVNVGDILEIISNGVYHIVEHREVVNSTKERLSVTTFYSPRIYVEIEPAQRLITPDTPAIYRNIIVEEYFKRFYAHELIGRSYIDVMKIKNKLV